MLNITGYGRIASDIPLKQSKDKKHLYTNFLMASHKLHKGSKDTTFIRCVAFDAMATMLHDYFSQGDRIFVKGILIKDDYKGKKDSFKIKVEEYEFVETLSEHNKNKENHPPKIPKEVKLNG